MGFKSLSPSATLECEHGCVQRIQTSVSGQKTDDKTLDPFFVKSGRLAGRWAVVCDLVGHHPDGKNWWGVWNKDRPPTGHAGSPSGYLPSITQPSSQKKPAVASKRLKTLCSKMGCKMASNRKCQYTLCAAHCIDQGGCLVHKASTTSNPSSAVSAPDWNMSDFQDPEGTEDAMLAAAMAESHLQSVPVSSVTSASTSQPMVTTLSRAAATALLPLMSQRPPTCSTQLSDTWTKKKAELTAEKTQKEIDDIDRSKAEEDMKRNLSLLWFDADDVPGVQYSLQGRADLPIFPFFRLNEHLTMLGTDITGFQQLNRFRRWMRFSSIHHLFPISNHQTLILRRDGVTRTPGIDEDITRIRDNDGAAHFCDNPKGETQSVRDAKLARRRAQKEEYENKRKQTLTSIVTVPSRLSSHLASVSSSDDSCDEETADIISDAAVKKRHCPDAKHDGGRPVKRSRTAPSPCQSPSPISISSNSPSPMEAPSSPMITSPLLSRASSPLLLPFSSPILFPSSSSSSNELTEKKAVRKGPWHQGLHCVEVAQGFELMDSPKLSGLSMETRFREAFPGRPFKQRTVQDNRAQWFKLSGVEEKDMWIQRGLETRGLWSSYMREHKMKESRH